jgi:hypothetical protein
MKHNKISIVSFFIGVAVMVGGTLVDGVGHKAGGRALVLVGIALLLFSAYSSRRELTLLKRIIIEIKCLLDILFLLAPFILLIVGIALAVVGIFGFFNATKWMLGLGVVLVIIGVSLAFAISAGIQSYFGPR